MKALEDLVAPLAKRLNSSIVSSFIISWTAVNWKFIVTLIFASQPIKLRIEEAEGYLSNFTISWLVPIIMTFFHVIILPIVDSFIISLNANVVVKNNETSNKIKFANLLGEIENARKEKELNDIKSGYAEVETLNQENEKLRTLLEQKNTIIEDNAMAMAMAQDERDNAMLNLRNDYEHMQGLYRETAKELEDLKKGENRIFGIQNGS